MVPIRGEDGREVATRTVSPGARRLRRRFKDVWAEGRDAGIAKCEQRLAVTGDGSMPATLEGRIHQRSADIEEAMSALHLRLTVDGGIPEEFIDDDVLSAFQLGFAEGWEERPWADSDPR